MRKEKCGEVICHKIMIMVKNGKDNMKNKQLKIMIVILIVLVIVMLTVVILKEKELSKTNDKEQMNSKSVISTIEEQINNEEAFSIETKYGNLYFPLKWKENISIKNNGSDIVEFYGNVNEIREQHLFDIVYGNSSENIIGSIKVGEEDINVSFNLYELNIEDEWSDEEVDAFSAMQEDINYLIGMLVKGENFTLTN